MMTRTLALSAALLLPFLTYAASFKEIVEEQIVPLGDAIVGLMFALAFLFFLFGMLRFFFTGSQEQREQGKAFALWGIVGFVVLFGVWGFVRLLISILPSAGS
jgi:hypothetical protein